MNRFLFQSSTRSGLLRQFLTMHELKQLVDDSLEELPVGSEEARILANDVHDVRRYDGLVVLPSFLLTQAEQVLNTSHTHSVNIDHSSKHN